jgi:drug/metabolite transporter (DMT)-like permease
VTSTPTETGQSARLRPRVWGALGIVYIVWGSTYLGIRVVVNVANQPPLFPTGARFLIAGLFLGSVMAIRNGLGVFRVPLRQAAGGVLLGVLFLCCGVGVVTLAEQTVPSALAALLVAAMPLWVVVYRAMLGRERPHRLTWAGTAIGFFGIAILARPGSHEDVKWWGVALVLLATVCWGFGVFISPRLQLPPNPFVTATFEMVGGGLILLVMAAVAGEYQDFSFAEVPAEGWWAFAYLTVMGSIVAFSAFVYLLGHAPVSLTTTYAYVNPVVAVFLGWLILSEPVTFTVVIGGSLAVLGVALVVSAERPRPVSPA